MQDLQDVDKTRKVPLQTTFKVSIAYDVPSNVIPMPYPNPLGPKALPQQAKNKIVMKNNKAKL